MESSIHSFIVFQELGNAESHVGIRDQLRATSAKTTSAKTTTTDRSVTIRSVGRSPRAPGPTAYPEQQQQQPERRDPERVQQRQVTGNFDVFVPSGVQQRKLHLTSRCRFVILRFRRISETTIRRNGETQSLCFDLRSQFLLFVRVDARARQREVSPYPNDVFVTHIEVLVFWGVPAV